MARPDLTTLACVHPECQQFRQSGQGHLVIRKIYGRDRIRLVRCRPCCEECSERRGSALVNTKLPESTAEDVINHLGEGCSVRATAHRAQGCKERGARLFRVSGRHAARLHNEHGRDLRPMALECDDQWRLVKKSKHAVWITNAVKLATVGSDSRGR